MQKGMKWRVAAVEQGSKEWSMDLKRAWGRKDEWDDTRTEYDV